MAHNATAAANCSTFDAVFAAHVHPEICDQHRSIIHATFNALDIDERTVATVLTLLDKGAAVPEPPMSVAEAVKLTGLTPQGLNYHARRGRLRRAYVPGSTRALGYVRADILAIANGLSTPDSKTNSKMSRAATKAAKARWRAER